jgi:hypothetical protein
MPEHGDQEDESGSGTPAAVGREGEAGASGLAEAGDQGVAAASGETVEPAPSESREAEPSSLQASRLSGVGATVRDGRIAVRLHADGRLRYVDGFVEEPPDRLVLDLDGIVNHVTVYRIPVGTPPVDSVRVAQFGVDPRLITRVVVDLQARVPYRIEEHSDGLTLWIDCTELTP